MIISDFFHNEKTKQVFGYLVFFISVTAVYSAGVYSRVPQGIIAAGGIDVVRQTLLDALLNYVYAGLIGRLLIFVVSPSLFMVLRVLILAGIPAASVFGRRRALRLAARLLGRIDQLYAVITSMPTRAAVVVSFPVFGYLCVESVGMLIFAILISCFAFSMESFNDEIRKKGLRIKFRRKYIDILPHSILLASAITSALFFSYLIGKMRLDALIESGSEIESDQVGESFVIVAVTSFGFILAEKVGEDGDHRDRDWLLYNMNVGRSIFHIPSISGL